MIEPVTGMKPGERYYVEHLERGHHFRGFFLDGKYYLAPELLTAVGWLEGQRFLYDDLDASGEPVFPDRVAGIVENLTLTLADGTSLRLNNIDADAFEALSATSSGNLSPSAADTPRIANPRPKARYNAPIIFVITASVLIAGVATAWLRHTRR